MHATEAQQLMKESQPEKQEKEARMAKNLYAVCIKEIKKKCGQAQWTAEIIAPKDYHRGICNMVSDILEKDAYTVRINGPSFYNGYCNEIHIYGGI